MNIPIKSSITAYICSRHVNFNNAKYSMQK